MESKCLPPSSCTGVVTIRTALGGKDVSCNEAKAKKWSMPGTLEYNGCVETFKGIHPCDDNPSLLLNCKSHLNWLIIVMFVVALLTGLSLIVLKRWMVIRRAFSIKGNQLIFSKKSVRCKQGEDTVATYSYKLVLLYLLFGVNFVEMCIVPNQGMATISPGAILCTNNGNHTIKGLGTSFVLAHAYDTSEWTISTEKDWGCAGGSCPSIEDCHGEVNSNPIIEFKAMRKSFCKNHVGACAFGRGCTMGIHKVTLVGSVGKVYKLALQIPTIVTDIILGDCEVSYVSNPITLAGEHTVVRLPKGNYLCPMSANERIPMFGTLGDVQIKEGLVGFPWKDLACSESWYTYHDCRLPPSFFPLVEKTCTPIPGPYAGGNLYFTSSGVLMLSDDREQRASVHCSGNTTIVTENAHCTIDTLQVWGIRDHSTGIFLTGRATSNNPNQEVKVDHPCYLGQDIIIQCNGEYHYWPLNEYDNCENATDKTITDHQATFVGYSIDSTTSTWSRLDSGLNISSLLIGSMANLLVWAVLIALICRK